MYSRSYGTVENGERSRFSVPPDYAGSFYRKEETLISPQEAPVEEAKPREAPPQEEKKPSAVSGGGSFLERLTAEDILFFALLYSLIRGENEDSGSILGLILALLVL